jgi:hypothetical protein
MLQYTLNCKNTLISLMLKAKALLSQYTQAVLRDRGKKQRYWVDAKGMPLKLVHQKNVAP